MTTKRGRSKLLWLLGCALELISPSQASRTSQIPDTSSVRADPDFLKATDEPRTTKQTSLFALPANKQNKQTNS